MIKELNLYELIGLIIGDGYLYYNQKKGVYFLEITGNANESLEYFKKIARFILKETGKLPRIKVKNEIKGKSLKLYFNNKEYLKFLIYEINIIHKNKTFDAKIPEKFLSWNKMKHVIRGLFEADGSLYFSKGKRNVNYYPRLEIKSSSKNIINQVTNSLRNHGFRVIIRKCGDPRTFGIHICGFKMLEKWNNEIGFGSFNNYSKYLLWKKLNFYIPRITLEERKNLLAEVRRS